MSLITNDTDRLVLVQMTKDFLATMLLCRDLAPGVSITSDLPDDARVLHVYEASDDVVRRTDVITVVMASESFDPVPQGERPPIRLVTFTRREAVK